MFYLKKAEIPQSILNCYPEYTGQKFRLVESNGYTLNNYWNEGSRSYCKVVDFTTGEIFVPDPQTSNPFTRIAHTYLEIPHNHAVVEHAITCGKDAGLFIYVNKDNINKLLPNPQVLSLTEDEKLCLKATQQYKSTYAGISRRQQIGMSPSQWGIAQQSLIEKKLLKKNGALTIEGKNYRG